jgi:hypothetical protein
MESTKVYHFSIIDDTSVIETKQVEIKIDSSIGAIKSIVSVSFAVDINDVYLFYQQIDTIPDKIEHLPNYQCIKTNIVDRVGEGQYLTEIPIGYQAISKDYNNWIANPYKYKKDIPFARVPNINNNKNLMNGGIHSYNDTIYICLKNAKTQDYFNKQSLGRFNKILLKETELFEKWTNSVNTELSIDNIETKIKSIKIELSRGYFFNKKEDLLSIFKSTHTSPSIPIIKFNPSNVNRLFRLQLNSNGDDLYLDRTKVLKYNKDLNTNKTISFVFDNQLEQNIYVELIESTGNLNIIISLKESIEEDKLNHMIEKIILILNRHIQIQIPFSGIKNSKIVDMEIEFFIYGELTNLDFSKINCNSSVAFLIDKKQKNIFMGKMFRVPEFNIMDELRQHVREAMQNKISQNTILQYIEKRYNMTRSESSEYYTALYQENVVATDAKVNNKFKINDGVHINAEKKLYNATNFILVNCSFVKYYEYIYILKSYIELLIKSNIECSTQNNSNKAIFITDNIDDNDDDDYDNYSEKLDIYNYDEESDDESEIEGGEADVDGFNLVNYMQNRIEKYDKKLILKHNVGKYKPYSSSCQSSDGRQPIALNTTELNNIKENASDFLNTNKYVSYKSSEDSQIVHYICPRYWDLKNNLPLTSDDIKNKGLEDNIISRKSNIKTATNDKYILETSDRDGQLPSFQLGKHPDPKVCLPCCFQKETNNVLDKMDKCNIYDETKIKYNTNPIAENKIKKKRNRISIIPISERKILPATHISLIPTILQKIVYPSRDFNGVTMIPGISMLMKRGVYVEKYSKQTFLSSIADALWSDSIQYIPDIERLKNMFDSITIDEYITLNNGELLNYFKSHSTSTSDTYNNDVHKSKVYTQLTASLSNDELIHKINKTFNDAVTSKNNFLKYIHSTNSIIDYKFIWSYVVKLFPSEINLIILSINENDNLSVICPTDKSTFDKNKDSLFLIESKGDYSPIYKIKCKNAIQCSKENIIMEKIFKPNNNETMILFDYVIHPSIKKCIATHTKSLISLQRLFKYFDYKDTIIQTYNITTNNITGIFISIKQKYAWIPCVPSSPFIYHPIVIYSPELINNSDLVDYNESVKTSHIYYQKTDGELNYKPKQMVVSGDGDGLQRIVIGYISEANIFIPCRKTLLTDIKQEYFKEIKQDTKSFLQIQTGYLFGKDNNRINFISDFNKQQELYVADEVNVVHSLQDSDIKKINDILNNITLKQQSKVSAISNILSNYIHNILNTLLIADKIVRNIYFRNKIIYKNNDYQQLKISNYSLNENEIIVLESWFLQPTWKLYETELKSKDNIFHIETINPIMNNEYKDEYTILDLPSHIKYAFPDGTVIRRYSDYWFCIIDTLKIQIHKQDIVSILEQKYNSIDTSIIYNHFNSENKNEYVKLIKNNFLSLTDYIYSDKYVLSLLDFFILFNHYGYNIVISIFNDNHLKQFFIQRDSISDNHNTVWMYIDDKGYINILYNYDNLSFDGDIHNAIVYKSLQEYFEHVSQFLQKK